MVLAENAGMDPIDAQAQLRAKITGNKPRYGIDMKRKKISDTGGMGMYTSLWQ